MGITKNAIRKRVTRYKNMRDRAECDDIIPPDKKMSIQDELKFWKKKCDKVGKKESFDDRFLDLIKSHATKFSSLELKTKKDCRCNSDGEEQKLVSLIGDTHIGEVVEGGIHIGVTDYNVAETKRKFESLYNQIIDCIYRKPGYKYDEINIHLLGDLVCGGPFKHAELYESGENIADQMVFASEIIAQFIKQIADKFELVKVVGVPGNHGTVTKKPKYKYPHENYDWLVMKWIESKFSFIDKVKFDIPKSFYAFNKIYDKNFLLMHGQGIKFSHGLPYYGLDRKDKRLNQIITYEMGIYPHYITLGHLHTPNEIYKVGGQIIINGSFKGSDEYGLYVCDSVTPSTQKVFSVKEGVGVTWSENIYLD